jgi:hypothetical protein
MTSDNDLDTGDVSIAKRRAMMFGFGALTTAAAVDAVNNAALSKPFRDHLLAQVTSPGALFVGAIVYTPLIDKLNTEFSQASLPTTVDRLRTKCGPNLETYQFGGFIAAPVDDANNSYPIDPGRFRQDRSRFPTTEVNGFEAGLRQVCALSNAGRPGYMWPINFLIYKGDLGDGKSHLHLTRDATGARLWRCYVVCYDN